MDRRKELDQPQGLYQKRDPGLRKPMKEVRSEASKTADEFPG